MVLTSDGNTMYISDHNNNRIRTLNTATLDVETLAGNGIEGEVDGAGTNARLKKPRQLALSPDNTIMYIASYYSCQIRQIVIATKVVSTFVGTETGCSAGVDGTGSGVQSNGYTGLVISPSSDYLYLMDKGSRVRRVHIATLVSTTVMIRGVRRALPVIVGVNLFCVTFVCSAAFKVRTKPLPTGSFRYAIILAPEYRPTPALNALHPPFTAHTHPSLSGTRASPPFTSLRPAPALHHPTPALHRPTAPFTALHHPTPPCTPIKKGASCQANARRMPKYQSGKADRSTPAVHSHPPALQPIFTALHPPPLHTLASGCSFLCRLGIVLASRWTARPAASATGSAVTYPSGATPRAIAPSEVSLLLASSRGCLEA